MASHPTIGGDLAVGIDFWILAGGSVVAALSVAWVLVRRLGRRRRGVLWLPIVLPIITAIAMYLIVQPIFERREWRTFDAALWKADGADQGNPSLRSRMARDLVHRGKLEGLTRAELAQRLGDPSDLPAFAPDLAWRLGVEQGLAFGVDQEWLIVQLGPDGRAASARIRGD